MSFTKLLTFAPIIASLILCGCAASSKKPLELGIGSGSTTSAASSPTTTTNSTNNNSTTTSTVASPNCKTPLQATLRLLLPSTPVILVNSQARWEVNVTGCSGVYTVSMSNVPVSRTFSTFLDIDTSYRAVGIQYDTAIVSSLDERGVVIASISVRSQDFNVVSSISTNTASQVPTSYALPTCRLQRQPGIVAKGAAMPFLFTGDGTFTVAGVNGMNVSSGQIIPVLPNALGDYVAQGMIQGPGGTGFCSAVVYPPSCTLAVVSTNVTSTNFNLNIKGDVVLASIEGVQQVLPTSPNTVIPYTKQNAAGTNATLSALVMSSYGDQATCSVTYRTCPAETVIPVTMGGRSMPLNDCGYGASCNSSSFSASGGTIATQIASNLKAGDRIKIEGITGQFTVPWPIDCLTGQGGGADFNHPTLVPVVQFTSELNVVQNPGVYTPSNRMAVLLRDLQIGMTIPNGVTKAWASIPDWLPSDNGGSCSFQVRITPSCN